MERIALKNALQFLEKRKIMYKDAEIFSNANILGI